MEVILSQNVEHLGQVGDLVKVKDGYARNYLLPNRLAMKATKSNLRSIEAAKAKRLAAYEAKKQEAQTRADEIAKISCTINVEVNEEEKLYGAVSEAEIIAALADEGHNFDKKDLVIEKPVNEIGIFEIGIKLHPEVIAKFRLWVAKK